MKKNTKQTTSVLAAIFGLAACNASQAAIVYQDNFDNDGAANTAGTGGQLLTGWRNSGSQMTDTGSLGGQTNDGGRQSWAWTQNQFDLSAGFKLDLNFTTVATGNPSFTYSFGIIDEVDATTGNGGLSNNLTAFGTNETTTNFIAFSSTDRNTALGLNSDFGTLAEISNGLNTAINLGTTQDFSLTVNADGSGSASLDTTTVNFAAGSLSGLYTASADDKFHFAVFSQGNSSTGGMLNSVSIDTVPEPSSTALLGLGGLALLMRRRK